MHKGSVAARKRETEHLILMFVWGIIVIVLVVCVTELLGYD